MSNVFDRGRLSAVLCCLFASGCATTNPVDVSANAGSPSTLVGPVDTTIETDDSPSSLDALNGNLSYEIVATYPHDPAAFTQGLEIVGSTFVESTGLFGESDRRIVDIESGDVLDSVSLPDEVFGEGLTVVDDKIYQLTWQSGRVFVADLATLEQTDELALDGQGWGLCYDGANLVSSNGSSILSVADTESLNTLSAIIVTVNGREQDALNELECVDGYIFANVYRTPTIILIDQATGVVTATLDLSDLLPGVVGDPANDVLNGIAYRAETNTLFVTGKRWDTIYELSLSAA